MKRRSFLKVVGAASGAYAVNIQPILAAQGAPPAAEKKADAEFPKRVLGRTGAKISVVGFPGLCLIQYDQKRGTEGIHSAFDRGINYFDIAPAYGNGECETRMGIGLQGIPRDKIFLSCKTKMRDKDGARKELENSLTKLKTDHFDLYQMHHLVKPEEVQKAMGPGGAMETFLKAREEGKVKYFGFSAHTTKGALEALKLFPQFDTVMFPFNFVEYFLNDSVKTVMETAAAQGASLIAIKPMSRGTWPKGVDPTRRWWYRSVEDDLEVRMAWRFTLSQKGMVTGIPPSYLDLLDKAMNAVRDFRPITEPEMEELKRIAKNTGSIFTREEAMVAMNGHQPGCPYGWA